MKTAKKQFLASVVSLLLCVSMLVGTTFAWFTDSVASNNNFIKSGNLDVTLEYYDGTQWQPVEEDTALIDNGAKWEPGFAQVVYLRIANEGSLALKYQLSANVLADEPGTNVEGNEFYLSDYIKFGVKESANAEFYSGDKAGRDAAVADVDAGAKLISSADKVTGELTAGQKTFVTYVVYMPASVGNVANHNGIDSPEIKLGVNVAATQLDYEGDDFGTDYDDATTYPVVSAPVTRPAAGGSESVSLKAPVENAVEVVLPAAVVDALPAGVTSVGIAHSEPKVDTANNTVTFDSIEVVDQNGNVIDLADLTLTEDITVTIPLGTAFAAGKEVAVYHDGALVATAIVDQNGNISYGAAHLCEVTVAEMEKPTVNETTGEIEISSALQLIAFANDVNVNKNTYSGKTVKLTADIDLNGFAWTPIGQTGPVSFAGSFDGNGKTIYNLSIDNTANTSEYGASGLFGWVEQHSGSNSIKNLTIDGVNIVSYRYSGAVAGWINIPVVGCTVKNVNIDCSYYNDDTDGTKVGALVGYADNKSALTDNTVENATINAYGDVGGLAGIAQTTVTVEDNVIKNVKISYVSDKKSQAGEVISTRVAALVGENTVENVTITKE